MVAMWLGMELVRKWPLIFLSQEAEQYNVNDPSTLAVIREH